MREATATVLKRLSKGKSGLSEDALLEFCDDIRRSTNSEISEAIAQKKPSSKKPAAPKPSWLIEMEATRKRLQWTASESVSKLIEIAADEGFISADFFASRKTAPTFPTAAKQIAKKSGGVELSNAFSREISRLEREYRLG